MRFNKDFAEGILNAIIARNSNVVADCDSAKIAVYLRSAAFANGMIQYYGFAQDQFIEALICFDFEWGGRFEDLYHRAPSVDDWNASYYDRANAFADMLGALKPYDNSRNVLRAEYVIQ